MFILITIFHFSRIIETQALQTLENYNMYKSSIIDVLIMFFSLLCVFLLINVLIYIRSRKKVKERLKK